MLSRTQALLALLALAAGLPGCFAYTNVKRDNDRLPIVHTGVGATILMPGQSAPALPQTVRGVGRPGAPAPVYAPGGAPAPGGGGSSSGSYSGYGSGSGSGSASGPGSYGAPVPGEPPVGGGGNIQFIGGAEIDEQKHVEYHQDPLILKTLFAPVAAVAWPFKKVYQALQGDPQPVVGPAPQGAAPPPGPRDYYGDYEASQLEALDRQVGGAPPPPQVASAPRARPRAARGRRASADDRRRARLAPAERGPARRRARAGRRRRRRAPHRRVSPTRSATATATGGPTCGSTARTGRWCASSSTKTATAASTTPSSTTRRPARRPPRRRTRTSTAWSDSWVEYRGGEVVRRRQDTNGDGQPDAWTLYRGRRSSRASKRTATGTASGTGSATTRRAPAIARWRTRTATAGPIA